VGSEKAAAVAVQKVVEEAVAVAVVVQVLQVQVQVAVVINTSKLQ